MAATSEQAVARATDKLGETPEKMRDMPDELRKALEAKADDPKVADIRDDMLKACEQPDIYLLRFLRVRKYDVEAAVSNVIGWFRWLNVQQKLPTDLMKVFSDGQEQSAEKADGADLTYWGCKAADVKDVLESDAFGVLPGYTKDGSKCMCISDVGAMIGLMKIHPVKKVMLSTTYLLEQLSFDPNVQVCGLALLYDCENYSLSLLKEVRATRQPPRASRCNVYHARRLARSPDAARPPSPFQTVRPARRHCAPRSS